MRRGVCERRVLLLNNFWTAMLAKDGLQDFAARAFLRPYAEFVRSRIEMQWENHPEA
jgi:predicted transcriptional regulator